MHRSASAPLAVIGYPVGQDDSCLNECHVEECARGPPHNGSWSVWEKLLLLLESDQVICGA
ncbi:hypothetical protein ZHAS_00020721 [Anopheles sinensis]|uniref:Uncharacterized protein n=1 Tax=Anopheles sinensis TaxID=74873 RepID=A0A084WQI4_ANOSI|nr:hypothetical protein ZHAS_00020721 [Anopheles sinensis]